MSARDCGIEWFAVRTAICAGEWVRKSAQTAEHLFMSARGCLCCLKVFCDGCLYFYLKEPHRRTV